MLYMILTEPFQRNYPGFVAPFTRSLKELVLSVHVAGHFPWFLKLLQFSPDWLVGLLNPGMKPVFSLQNVIIPCHTIGSTILKYRVGDQEADH